ncbi:protein croquemort-like isoform X2 [Chelonus insularis]|nr:protein croquemort-like isoform X2 [Chelonus insularis]
MSNQLLPNDVRPRAANFTNKNIVIQRQTPPKMGVSKITLGIIFGIATIAIITGVAVGFYWSSIFDRILRHELILSPTSQSYLLWEKTPIPMYLKVYLFNWTNPHDFKNPESKPHFNELGPYVFQEIDYKVNQIWNDNETVTFQQKRIWIFQESMSNGTLNDRVTNLNPIAASVGYQMRYKSEFIQRMVNIALEMFNESTTITKSVREVLFDGYEDKFLEVATKLNLTTVPYTRFGWFYARNGSDFNDGTFNVRTGLSTLTSTGILQEWNYSNKSKYFPGQCGHINGTLGDLWPVLPDNATVPVFAPDVCTLLNLEYHNTSEHNGLIGKKFISTSRMFDNGTKVPSRACYCQGVECQPSGTLNVSSCKFNAPAFVSLPHFNLADESYINAVTGLKPDQEKHQFYMVVQPDVGVPLQVRARLQLNLLVQPSKVIKIFKKIPRVYMPILWFSQEADLTPEYTKQIQFILTLPTLGEVTFYGIASIGLLLSFIGFLLCLRGWKKADDAQRLISKREETGVPPN